ncbi:hypothetical protein OXX59_004887 [Metschnikowia pulcherrima]
MVSWLRLFHESISKDLILSGLDFSLTSHGLVRVEKEIINGRVTLDNEQHEMVVLVKGTFVGEGLTEEQMMKEYVPTLLGSVMIGHEQESEEMD